MAPHSLRRADRNRVRPRVESNFLWMREDVRGRRSQLGSTSLQRSRMVMESMRLVGIPYKSLFTSRLDETATSLSFTRIHRTNTRW